MVILIFLQNLFLALNRGSYLDPDLGWRLRLGKYMAETGTLPTKFIGYNYFHDLHFVDHQWLANLVIFKLYDQFGYYSLFILSLLFTFSASWLLYKVCYKKTTSWFLSSLSVLLFLITLSQTYTGFRLQYFLYVGAGVILYFLHFVKNRVIRLVLYFSLFVLGSNIHGGGFLFLLPVVVLLEADDLLAFPYKLRELPRRAIYPLILLIILFVAMSINPYGISFWATMWDYVVDPYYKGNIAEWLPISSLPFNWVNAIIFSLLIFLITVEKNWKKIKWNILLLFMAVGYLAYSSKRTMPIFVYLMLPEVIELLQAGSNKIKKIIQTIFFAIMNIAIVIFLIGVYGKGAIKVPSFDIFQVAEGYPKEAAEYYQMIANSEDELFNFYDWGGYLAWVNQDNNIFIDGRSPQTRIKKGKTILNEYKRNLESFDYLHSNFDYVFIHNRSEYKCSRWVLLANCSGLNIENMKEFNRESFDIVYEDSKSIIYKPKK